MICLQPQTRSCGRCRTQTWAQVPSPTRQGRQRHQGCTCCSEEAVIWRGRQDKHTKQLVNKITARLMVLYPDIIKYMLYNTIRDKSEAQRTNYTGQRVSKRELQGASAVTECSRGQRTRTSSGWGRLHQEAPPEFPFPSLVALLGFCPEPDDPWSIRYGLPGWSAQGPGGRP